MGRLGTNSLALGHHLAVHGAGATIAAVINTGQTTGGYPAVSAAAERNQHLEKGLAGACGGLGAAGEGRDSCDRAECAGRDPLTCK